MTESIFVPFRLTTKESIEKAIKVLTSDPTPWPESDGSVSIREITGDEAKEFSEKVKARYANVRR